MQKAFAIVNKTKDVLFLHSLHLILHNLIIHIFKNSHSLGLFRVQSAIYLQHSKGKQILIEVLNLHDRVQFFCSFDIQSFKNPPVFFYIPLNITDTSFEEVLLTYIEAR